MTRNEETLTRLLALNPTQNELGLAVSPIVTQFYDRLSDEEISGVLRLLADIVEYHPKGE